jgi:ribosomal protein S18 acetylase RimI-like enzyme
MAVAIRRLSSGDEAVLALLARDEADFDLADRGESGAPLARDDAASFLADPHVLHWVAEDQGLVVGHMYGHVLRKRAGCTKEILLYEIGVRAGHRRRGIGRELVGAMTTWMKSAGVRQAWVVADNEGAVKFYEECGFGVSDEAPVYMALDLAAPPWTGSIAGR